MSQTRSEATKAQWADHEKRARLMASRKCIAHNRKLRKLTDEEARDVRVRVDSGEAQNQLAKEYSISQTALSSLCRRKTYKDVA